MLIRTNLTSSEIGPCLDDKRLKLILQLGILSLVRLNLGQFRRHLRSSLITLNNQLLVRLAHCEAFRVELRF